VLLLLCARLGEAQTVRGTVRDSEGVLLRGAFVVLLDSAGNMRAGTLSNESGQYALRVSDEGRYSIRAELIGHKSTTLPPFLLPVDSVRTVDLMLPVSAIEVTAVTAQASRRCVARPESAAQTERVWEEVRKALRVTAWAQKISSLRLATLNYVRMLDPFTLQVRSEESRDIHNRPYASVNPDTLARWGFARVMRGDTTEFYGPDAELMLSNAFLNTHCFHVELGRDETAGMVGLTFQPVQHRRVPEIIGTLWLDPRTSELKYIDYRYVNLPRSADDQRARGRTYFRRSANGVWLVDHWYIRMPVRFAHGRRAGALASLREEGGEVLNLKDAAQQTIAPNAAIRGVAFDSVHAAPLANALVYISGTTYKAETDAAGRFTIDNVPPGSYQLALWHPLLDSLPVLPKPRQIELHADTAQIVLAIPSQQSLVASACPDHPQAAVLIGYVYDADGAVLADWQVLGTYAGADKTALLLRTKTEESGRYVLCAVPQHKLIRVSAEGARAQLTRLDRLRYARLDLPAQ